jgi:hypothetical protein
MIWYSQKRGAPSWARGILFLAGVGTIAYNLRNYIKYRQAGTE